MMAKHQIIALLLSVVSLLSITSAQGRRALVYVTYTNFKYFYAVDYPRGLLIPQGEPDAGDGQVFLSRRNGAKMTVYASYNVFNQTLAALYRGAIRSIPLDHHGLIITYRHRDKRGFVVSGLDSDQVFYERLTMRDDRTLTLLLDYPVRRRVLYDPVTAHVARSLQLLPQG